MHACQREVGTKKICLWFTEEEIKNWPIGLFQGKEWREGKLLSKLCLWFLLTWLEYWEMIWMELNKSVLNGITVALRIYCVVWRQHVLKDAWLSKTTDTSRQTPWFQIKGSSLTRTPELLFQVVWKERSSLGNLNMCAGWDGGIVCPTYLHITELGRNLL